MKKARVVLMDGLAGGPPVNFSAGLDKLNLRLSRISGVSVLAPYSFTHHRGALGACEIAHAAGERIVLGGHSLGGNWATRLAAELDAKRIPVHLLCVMDATWSTLFQRCKPIGNNVITALNWYNVSGSPLGKVKLKPARGYRGKIVNTALHCAHQNVDDNLDVHETIERYVSRLVGR